MKQARAMKAGMSFLYALLSILFGCPAYSQSLSTSLSTCEQKPFRRDNEYTRNPYDDVVYYNCVYVEDGYDPSRTTLQSRKTCEYTKLVYYDQYMNKWTSKIGMSQCRIKNYEKESNNRTVVPEGWHPPLIAR